MNEPARQPIAVVMPTLRTVNGGVNSIGRRKGVNATPGQLDAADVTNPATFHAKTAVTGLPLSHPPEAELSGAIHHSLVLRLHSPENFIHLLA